MEINKNLLKNEFNKKSFVEKKKTLIEMLSKMYWTNEKINKLWKIVYNLSEKNEAWLYLDVYDILIDAFLSTENQDNQIKIDNFSKIQSLLAKFKEEEKQEIEQNKLNLENIFNNL